MIFALRESSAVVVVIKLESPIPFLFNFVPLMGKAKKLNVEYVMSCFDLRLNSKTRCIQVFPSFRVMITLLFYITSIREKSVDACG